MESALGPIITKATRKQLLEHIVYLEGMVAKYANPKGMLPGHKLVYQTICQGRADQEHTEASGVGHES